MPSLDVVIDALKAKAGAAQFDSAVARVQKGAKGADTDIKKMDKSVNSLGSSMRSLGKLMVAGVGFYSLSRFVKSGVQELAKFEKQLAQVSTMLDDQTMKYLPQYSEELASLSVLYGESTETLSKGLYDILSASIDAADALEVLEVSAQSAKAGLTDTGLAADAITTILNSYQMEASEAGRVSDILFAIVKRGKTTFAELAPAIGQVTSLAASARLSMEEVAAALATMTRAGINTHIAVTSLKSILTTFLSPQQDAVDTAKKWGIELNSNTLKTIGLTGVVRQLTKLNKESVSSIFGNVRALTGLSALLQQVTGHTEDLAFVQDSAGLQQEAYAKITDTTAHKLDQLNQVWKKWKREAVEGAIPLIEQTTEYMVENESAIRRMSKAFSEFATQLLPGASLELKGWLFDIAAWTQEGTKRFEESAKVQRTLAKSLYDAADAIRYNRESLAQWTDAGQKADEINNMLNQGFQEILRTVDPLSGATNIFAESLADVADKTQAVIIPSEELTIALVEVEDALGKIQGKIDTFGMSAVEKQIYDLKKASKGLTGGEKGQYEDAIGKLEEKGRELEQLSIQKDLQAEKERQHMTEVQMLLKMEEQTKQLEFERSLIGLTNEERDNAIAKQEALNVLATLENNHGGWGERAAEGYQKAAIELSNATAEHEKWMASKAKEKIRVEERVGAESSAESLIREIQLERELVFMTNEERERAIKLQKLEADTKVLGVMRSEELVEAYKAELLELQKAQQTATMIDELQKGVKGLAEAPLEALLDGTKDLGELVEAELRNIGANIIRTWYDQMITQQITQMTQGFFSNIFGGMMGGGSGGGLSPEDTSSATMLKYADGGVLNSPTLIPLATGVAIAAEAGQPEAVMPLRRVNGRLGVDASGSGGTQIFSPKIVNVIDPKVTGQYLDTGEGEQHIVNIIRRNRQAIEVN